MATSIVSTQEEESKVAVVSVSPNDILLEPKYQIAADVTKGSINDNAE